MCIYTLNVLNVKKLTANLQSSFLRGSRILFLSRLPSVIPRTLNASKNLSISIVNSSVASVLSLLPRPLILKNCNALDTDSLRTCMDEYSYINSMHAAMQAYRFEVTNSNSYCSSL